MMLTPEQLAELRDLANSAKYGGGNLEWLKAEELAIEWPQWDADFVAALSPDVMLKLLVHIDAQQARTDRAERALRGAGFTLVDGAAEWKPPLGPSASPLLDRIAELEALSDELLNTLNFERGQRAGLEQDAARYRWLRDSTKCESPGDFLNIDFEKMDAAIDSAMQSTWPEDTSDYASRIAVIGQNGEETP